MKPTIAVVTVALVISLGVGAIPHKEVHGTPPTPSPTVTPGETTPSPSATPEAATTAGVPASSIEADPAPPETN